MATTITIDCEEYLRLLNGAARNGGVASSGSKNVDISSQSGNYITNKPFTDWATWSHSWEGPETFGHTAGKYKEGVIKDVTPEKADKRSMDEFWKPNNISLINDPSVAIVCMHCVFWTGNAHLLYQVKDNPDVYGGRPMGKNLPRGHYRMSQALIDYFNRSDALYIFTKIQKQLGWYGQISMGPKWHFGHRRRWYSIKFHQRLLLNGEVGRNILNREAFLKMIETL